MESIQAMEKIQEEVLDISRKTEFPFSPFIITKRDFKAPLPEKGSINLATETYAQGILDITEAKPIPEVEYPYIESIPYESSTSVTLGRRCKIQLPDLQEDEQDKLFLESTLQVIEPFQDTEDPYDEEMAEMKYLLTNPVAFIIIGKPSYDHLKLAKRLAEYWGCVCIDAETCLRAEMEDICSPVACWCQKVLTAGRAIPSELVMKCMERRALSDEVMHRGYVLCGLPFIPEDVDPSVSEQMHMVFNWPIKPCIAIYITCPDKDIITKNSQIAFDYTSGNYVNKNIFSIDKDVHIIPGENTPSMENISAEIYNDIEQEQQLVAEEARKHLVVLPKPGLEQRLLLYRQLALPTVELHLAQMHPQCVVRVDGRLTPLQMLQTVKARLEALPLQRVFEPVRAARPVVKLPPTQGEEEEDEEEAEEEEGEGEDETEGKGKRGPPAGEGKEEGGTEEELKDEEEYVVYNSIDEAFREFSVTDAVAMRFKWKKSHWGYNCPVASSTGKFVEGQAKYAVRFLDKLYFLSSPEAMKAFMLNPREYLLPPNPKPTCKLVVVGHGHSGKTAVAEYLGQVFDGKVFQFSSFIEKKQKEERDKAIKEAQKAVAEEKIKTLNAERKQEYEKAVRDREQNVQQWHSSTLAAIQALHIPEYHESEDDLEEIVYEEEGADRSLAFDLREPLIPQLTLARCRWILAHPDDLYKYMPADLACPVPPAIPASEAEAAIATFVAEAVGQGMEQPSGTPDAAETVRLLVAGIREAEEQRRQQTGGEKGDGGWLLDGLPLDPAIWKGLQEEGIVPETIICLRDQEPEYSYLAEKWDIYKNSTFSEFEQKYPGYVMSSSVTNLLQSIMEKATWELEEMQQQPQQPQEPQQQAPAKAQAAGQPGAITATNDLAKYIEELKKFDTDLKSFRTTFPDLVPMILEVKVANKPVSQLLVEAVRSVEGRVRTPAEPYTVEDQEEELDYGAGLLGEDEIPEGEDDKGGAQRQRKWGDTGIYCPVAYANKNVLWQGKDDLLVKYKNKVYALSSKEAMEEFIERPWNYAPLRKPIASRPPLRICIVGPVGSGKTTVGRWLAKSLGLIHRDFEDDINEYLIPNCKPVGRKAELDYIQDAIRPKDAKDRGAPEAAETPWTSELRAAAGQYLRSGLQVPEKLVPCVLDRVWSSEPFCSTGLMYSGFPRHPEDIDLMKKHHLIPDYIIELTLNGSSSAKERLVKDVLDSMAKNADRERRKAEEAQRKQGDKVKAEFGTVEAKESANVVKALLSEAVEQLPSATGLFSTLPKLEKESRKKYEAEIDEWFTADEEKLATIRTLAEDESIPWLDINADKELEDVCMLTMFHLGSQAAGGRAVTGAAGPHPLEQTATISMEQAEKLLQSGYYFLSKFGHWCPVQVAEGKVPVSLYTMMKQSDQVFPVIHRRYIYFLGGVQNRDDFIADPMKYLQEAKPKTFVPIKIAIIGPPKSGKSTLVKRLAQAFHLKAITLGQSIRRVLDQLGWSDLATALQAHLEAGESVPTPLAMRCVEAATMDTRCASHGYILDGFPQTVDQIFEMATLNLIPYLVISLDCSMSKCFEHLQGQIKSLLSQVPAFSTKLLDHKYRQWHGVRRRCIKRLEDEYHNVVELSSEGMLWSLTAQATEQVYQVMKNMVTYYTDIVEGKPATLESMCVTPSEFGDRQSRYKNYCPVCLKLGMKTMGIMPKDVAGLLQYKEFYYWVCATHRPAFCEHPEQFLPPENGAQLPDILPSLGVPEPMLLEGEEEEEGLQPTEGGHCLVTYCDNLPKKVLVDGLAEYAVTYEGKLYYLASANCRERFLQRPEYYAGHSIRTVPLQMPFVSELAFPNLGFLEQNLSTLLQTVLSKLAATRPKYPGLPPDLSATLYIAYFLKASNKQLSATQKAVYVPADDVFRSRCDVFRKLCRRTKVRNPLLRDPGFGEPALGRPPLLSSPSQDSVLQDILKTAFRAPASLGQAPIKS